MVGGLLGFFDILDKCYVFVFRFDLGFVIYGDFGCVSCFGGGGV